MVICDDWVWYRRDNAGDLLLDGLFYDFIGLCVSGIQLWECVCDLCDHRQRCTMFG